MWRGFYRDLMDKVEPVERGVHGRLMCSNWGRTVVVVVSEAQQGGCKLVEKRKFCAGF